MQVLDENVKPYQYCVYITLVSISVHMNYRYPVDSKEASTDRWKKVLEAMNKCRNVRNVMSLLNLALQNVSLERQAMSEECEKLVHNVKTVKELRSHVVTHPNLGEEIGQSLQPVTDLLNARFQQMKLKDHHFKAGDVASEEQIQSVFDEVHAIYPSISVSDLSQNRSH